MMSLEDIFISVVVVTGGAFFLLAIWTIKECQK